MWQLKTFAGVLAFAFCVPASAGVQFATYEGPNAVQAGTGGAKIVAEGVDFWTDGTPPRRYQVLGYLTDTRGNGSFSKHAIGSKGLAKRVRELGGDALIVLDQKTSSESFGGMVLPNGFGGVRVIGRQMNTVSTKFAVVRYLPN